MKQGVILLAGLVFFGVTFTGALVASELLSQGTIDIQDPNETAAGTGGEGPVAVDFMNTGTRTRVADFDGANVEPGGTVTDDFVISNDEETDIDLTFDSCTRYERTYFVGSNGNNLEELNIDAYSPPVNQDVYVEVRIQIPEDAEPGRQDLCTEVTARPA